MKKLPNDLPDESRRRLLIASAAGIAAMGLLDNAMAAPNTAANIADDGKIHPFTIAIADSELIDLKFRLSRTRWPDKETVGDDSQGLQRQKLRPLVEYWTNGYNWRNVESRLNSLPQYLTRIDGLAVHFIHVRSRHRNAMPLMLTHGWPGSVLEFLKAIGPLTDPTAHGGNAEDAFDVVIPSIPGYGFSERPKDTGWQPARVARMWDRLMKRLGYAGYVSQGGDHGSVISNVMGRQAPAGLLGIHLTMPATVPDALIPAINAGLPSPLALAPEEQRAFDKLSRFFTRNAAYGAMMVTRPQTIGYALNDSPVGLAAWSYDKIAQWTDSHGEPERVLTRDEILDDLSLYWLTNTSASAARFYWENNNNNFSSAAQQTREVKVPVAISVFPGEIYQAPKSWSEKAFPTLFYYQIAPRGGHFAAWEQPDIFATELRNAFRPLRDKLRSRSN
ncbi:alpha/beta fold hydrolase [Serratia plymuthica]|uniref:epoxide hydrolase family protein n=1 Tax=Serratia plymuthica TaxID=82996 RepID=UPI001BAF9CEA|nr:epoxide hydrolase [Serratia plymuthica]QUY48087.1 alpha/beta fold hydrolase [Serratia plymuthica]